MELCERCGLDLDTLGVYKEFVHYDARYPQREVWCLEPSPEQIAACEQLEKLFLDRLAETLDRMEKDGTLREMLEDGTQ